MTWDQPGSGPDNRTLPASSTRPVWPCLSSMKPGLAVFERDHTESPQAFPPNWQQPVSYRIDGGVGALISFLHQQLVADSVWVDHCVESISQEDDGLAIHVRHGGEALTLRARHVVMTLPPHLAATTVRYAPPLPANVEAALLTTPTWMGQAMKVVVTYAQPFWREQGLSGTALSYAGPVQQFHDASPQNSATGAALRLDRRWQRYTHPAGRRTPSRGDCTSGATLRSRPARGPPAMPKWTGRVSASRTVRSQGPTPASIPATAIRSCKSHSWQAVSTGPAQRSRP